MKHISLYKLLSHLIHHRNLKTMMINNFYTLFKFLIIGKNSDDHKMSRLPRSLFNVY